MDLIFIGQPAWGSSIEQKRSFGAEVAPSLRLKLFNVSCYQFLLGGAPGHQLEYWLQKEIFGDAELAHPIWGYLSYHHGQKQLICAHHPGSYQQISRREGTQRRLKYIPWSEGNQAGKKIILHWFFEMPWNLGHVYALRLRFRWLQHQDYLQLPEKREEVQISRKYVADPLPKRNQLEFIEKQRKKLKIVGTALEHGGK